MSQVSEKRTVVVALDFYEKHYRSYISATRICQLYFFSISATWIFIPVSALYLLLSAQVVSAEVSPQWFPPGVWMHAPVVFLTLLVFAVFAKCVRNMLSLAFVFIALTFFVVAESNETLAFFQATESREFEMEESLVHMGRFAGLISISLWFFYIAVRAQKSFHELSELERSIVSDVSNASAGLRELACLLFIVPTGIRYAKNKTLVALSSGISGILNFVPYWIFWSLITFVLYIPFLIAVTFSWGVTVAEYYAENGLDTELSVYAVSGVSVAILILSLFLVGPYTLYIISSRSTALSRNFMRRSLQEVQAMDDRRPVLFLRSFIDDQVRIPSKKFSFEQWLLDNRARTLNLDQIILQEGTIFGPTVALGSPSDQAPPYGVARGYFAHDNWQEAVAALCETAAAVIICVDGTPGVQWELEHIIENDLASKTFFVFAPEYDGERRTEWVSRLSQLCSPGRSNAARNCDSVEPNQIIIGVRVTPTGQVETLTSRSASVYAYIIAVRLFLWHVFTAR